MHSKVSNWADYFLASIISMKFEQKCQHCQKPWYSSTAKSLNICEEIFCNHMGYAHCTAPHLHSIHSTTFTWLQCKHSLDSIQSEQHSCWLFQATAPTQLHQNLHLHSYLLRIVGCRACLQQGWSRSRQQCRSIVLITRKHQYSLD